MKSKLYSRTLAILLSLMLLVGLMPGAAFATGTGTGKAIQLGANAIQKGDSVYYGTCNKNNMYGYNKGDAIQWQVLDAEKDNTGSEGMFLLSKYLLKNDTQFEDAWNTDDEDGQITPNDWQNSTAQDWCKSFVTTSFAEGERTGIKAVSKADKDERLYNIDWEESKLDQDQAFFLSAREVYDHVSQNNGVDELKATYKNGSSNGWWLRSPYSNRDNFAGVVLSAGKVDYNYVDGLFASRPAFNLNLGSVLFTSAADGGKSSGAVGAGSLESVSNYSGNEWKLTLLDRSCGFSANVNGQTSVSAPAGGSMQITYSGARTGSNEYVSVLLCDSNNKALYYGNIAQNSASGTASVTIPSNLAGSYTLKVFSEQCNGDKKTDYASNFQNISLTVTGTPAPSYGISASPETLNFGSETVGYTTAPAAKTVTVTNTGNQNVTVALPTSTDYAVTAGTEFTDNTANLTPNGTATFTVQPRTGLAVGNHNETLSISGSNNTGTGVQLSFAVTEAAPPTMYKLSVNLWGGSGSTAGGEYAEGAVIHIDAGTRSDCRFSGWTSSNGGSFADASSASTTFTMPAANTLIMANWEYNGGTDKVIQIGASGISGYDGTDGYDYIYYGTWDGSPVKWRVLDTKTNMKNATEGDGLFLLSDALLGTDTNTSGGVNFQYSFHYGDNSEQYKQYHQGNPPSGGSHADCLMLNAWKGSDARDWCSDFYSSNLTTREQGAVLATTKSDEAFTSSTQSVPFAASEKILNGDKVFFLSAKEAETGDYGFTNDLARSANYGNTSGMWWLRSPCEGAENTDKVGVVTYEGFVSSTSAHFDWAARPAFNLNLDSVLFTSAADGDKSSGAVGSGSLESVSNYSGSEWKLTLLDRSRDFSANVNGQTSVSAPAGGSMQITYSGARTGSNEYVSVLLCDSSDKALYYGTIAQNSAIGTAKLNIPPGLAEGSYKLKVFSEQCNGSYKTDYASAFKEIELKVADLPQATTPNATFTAASDNGGTLSNVDTSMKYSVDGGTTWNAITGETMDITGVTAEQDVKVYKPGNGTTTFDSEAQTIDVTQAARPASIDKADCATSERNNGKITGVDSTMEYRLSANSKWTAVEGTTVEGLANGTYEVRVKANGTVLASTAATVTIGAHTCAAQGDWRHDGTNHWKLCACGAKVEEAAHTGGTATCTAKAVCEICGSEYSELSQHALIEHSYKAPTCMETGKEAYYTCKTCGKYFEDEAGKVKIANLDGYGIIPATGHKAGTAWKSDGTDHWNECVNCGEKMNEAAHDFEWITDKEPTGTKAGSRHEECAICGYAKAAVEIPATGTMALNKKIKATWSGSSLTVTWGKVSKADGYEVYAAKCGNSYTKVKTVKGSNTLKYTVKKISGKKLNTKTTYKVRVKAYRLIDGKKNYTGTSYSMHTAGLKNKTYTNAKSVKASKKSVILKKGKLRKASVKITKQTSKKKLLKSSHVAKLRYFSTNTKVATVTKAGTIKAAGKGTCTVYALAANGVKTTIKVTVK